ncbi:FIST C-terminal domain-containing protein [soil metagenome]
MDTGIPETLPTHTPDRLDQGLPVGGRAIARSSLAISANWEEGLQAVIAEVRDIKPDVVFLFVSAAFSEHFPVLCQRAWQESGAMLLLGSSANGVIAEGLEADQQPAIAMLALSLPGAVLRPVRFTQSMLDSIEDPETFRNRLGVDTADVNGWLLLADPFRMDASLLIDRMNDAYPGMPMIGGLASPAEQHRRTWVFLNGEVYGDGGIGLAIGGDYELLPVVSQGCEPIGEAWTITAATGQWVESISNRPALTVLAETLALLPDEMQEEAERNLVVGLAADEYRDRFGRGDFLIRNITGFDWKREALSLAARPRIGQTLHFHLRDAATASLDLTLMLTGALAGLGSREPVAGLIYSCNGRGVTMFGVPDHDAGELARRFGDLPHAGIIAAGEIGPVGKRTFLHGFTASMGIIMATRDCADPMITAAAADITPG